MSINMEEFGKLKSVTSEDDKRLAKEAKKEYMGERYKNNKEKWSEYAKENKERIAAYMKEYHETYDVEHEEEREEYMKEYNATYKVKLRVLGTFSEIGYSMQLTQQVNKNGKVIGIGCFTNIKTPEDNRRRKLKQIMENLTTLNKPFKGCAAHHMAKDIVIFIPKKLHESVSHNLETGRGMDEINKKAQIWFGGQLAG